MQRLQFSLQIESSQVERYYSGKVSTILVRATNGQSLRFPANLILPHVSRSGVFGDFVLSFDGNGKVLSLERL